MLYVRKLTEDAWRDRPCLDSDSISDLKVTNHELSVWQLKANLSNLEDVLLALAMTRNEICGLWYVVIDTDELAHPDKWRWQLEIQDQPGDTSYVMMKDEHKNIMISDIYELGYMGEYISTAISQDKMCYIDETKLKSIFRQRVTSNQIEKEHLGKRDKWKKEYNAISTKAN